MSNAGKEAVIAILGAGDFLGEGCLAGRPLYLATATAMSDCSIVRLEKPFTQAQLIGRVGEVLESRPEA